MKNNVKILSWDVGTKNLAYCILEGTLGDVESAKILDWNIISLENDSKNLHKLSQELFETLDSMSGLSENDVVVIENQPCMRNPKMKTMQIMLYSYFVIKCNVLKDSKCIINMMSANNKLKCYNGPKIELKTKSKSKYTIRKKMAIEHFKYFIHPDKAMYNYFLEHSKKDDLADSYLQGLYYLIKN
jgi:hypothetical protein